MVLKRKRKNMVEWKKAHGSPVKGKGNIQKGGVRCCVKLRRFNGKSKRNCQEKVEIR